MSDEEERQPPYPYFSSHEHYLSLIHMMGYDEETARANGIIWVESKHAEYNRAWDAWTAKHPRPETDQEKIARLEAENAALREIAAEVADLGAMYPYGFSELDYGSCPFCDQLEGKHLSDCPITKAREQLSQPH